MNPKMGRNVIANIVAIAQIKPRYKKGDIMNKKLIVGIGLAVLIISLVTIYTQSSLTTTVAKIGIMVVAIVGSALYICECVSASSYHRKYEPRLYRIIFPILAVIMFSVFCYAAYKENMPFAQMLGIYFFILGHFGLSAIEIILLKNS